MAKAKPSRIGNQKGESIHHHDQSITLHNFKITKTTNNNPEIFMDVLLFVLIKIYYIVTNFSCLINFFTKYSDVFSKVIYSLILE